MNRILSLAIAFTISMFAFSTAVTAEDEEELLRFQCSCMATATITTFGGATSSGGVFSFDAGCSDLVGTQFCGSGPIERSGCTTENKWGFLGMVTFTLAGQNQSVGFDFAGVQIPCGEGVSAINGGGGAILGAITYECSNCTI